MTATSQLSAVNGGLEHEAGPSTPARAQKVANFLSASEDEDEEEEPRPRISQKRSLVSGEKGSPNGKKKKREVNGGVKKRLVGGDDEEARRAEAERLFVGRQELPFYQGTRRRLDPAGLG
jgi:hypothetical protein